MIQRDVDATLLPHSYDVDVTEWTFVPTSSRTPDTPAYYLARVRVRTGAVEATEDAIILMNDLPAGDRSAREELVRKTINVAVLTAKARLDDSRPRSDRFGLNDGRSVA